MQTYRLYNNTVKIRFDSKYHLYLDKDGNRLLSVTGITSVIDKSGPLMGWAVKETKNYLINNWNVKKQYTESEKFYLLQLAAQRYRTISKQAADIGSQIHEWISQCIKGNRQPLPDNKEVSNGIKAFLRFQKKRNFKWLISERLVYSKKHNYVGTLDSIAQADNELILVDFKSSNYIYDEMRFQLSGYQIAYEEETGQRIDKRMIIRFGKTDGQFEPLELDNDTEDKETFLACLCIKRRINELSLKGA